MMAAWWGCNFPSFCPLTPPANWWDCGLWGPQLSSEHVVGSQVFPLPGQSRDVPRAAEKPAWCHGHTDSFPLNERWRGSRGAGLPHRAACGCLEPGLERWRASLRSCSASQLLLEVGRAIKNNLSSGFVVSHSALAPSWMLPRPPPQQLYEGDIPDPILQMRKTGTHRDIQWSSHRAGIWTLSWDTAHKLFHCVLRQSRSVGLTHTYQSH
jgi:hypothetical protein